MEMQNLPTQLPQVTQVAIWSRMSPQQKPIPTVSLVGDPPPSIRAARRGGGVGEMCVCVVCYYAHLCIVCDLVCETVNMRRVG